MFLLRAVDKVDGRTVTLTIELSATSNVCLEVVAEAWVQDVKVSGAA